MIAPADIDRLAKLCGLFSSDHDGERASAAAMADKLVREHGTTWAELFERLKEPERVVALHPALQHREDAKTCLASGIAWTKREADFLTNMCRKRRMPTPAQQEWLDALLERARDWKAAA